MAEGTPENVQTENAHQEDAHPRLPLRRDLRDGYEVHRAALAHGMNVTLLPRQILEVGSPDGSVTSSFVHGIPQSSTLSGVTYAQDTRMRRAELAKAGYAVPPGATFSVGRSARSAMRYAQKVGFPVVVKPAIGDNTTEVMPDVQDRQQLRQRIKYLYTPPSQRERSTRAAYALTELREPGRVDGQLVVPPGYRFLVEKQVTGEYLRLLVLQGEVISAVHCPAGPWENSAEKPHQDVHSRVHPSIREIAVGAARAVQGVALAALDVMVPDFAAETSVEEAVIVEYSERPWLQVQHHLDPSLAAYLGDRILTSELGVEALSSSRESVTVEFRIDGSVEPGALLPALKEESERLGIEAEAEVTDPAMGYVAGSAAGSAEDIAWLFESALDTGIRGQRAMLVEQRQVLAN